MMELRKVRINQVDYPVYYENKTWRRNPILFEEDGYYVYVSYEVNSNVCKIGQTTQPVLRLKGLNGGSRTVIPFYYRQTIYSQMGVTEKKFHKLFEDFRLPDKKEWFEVSPTVLLKMIQESGL